MPQLLDQPGSVVEAPAAEAVDWSAFFPTTAQRRAFDAADRGPWVVLDRAWARELGVMRAAGVYRIHRRALIARLAEAEAATGLRWLFEVPELAGNPVARHPVLCIA